MSRFTGLTAGGNFSFADIKAPTDVDTLSNPDYVIVTINGQVYGIPTERWNDSSREDDVILYRGRTKGFEHTLYPGDTTKEAKAGFSS